MQSPFYRAIGGPYREKLLEFGESVLAHFPEVGTGSGNPAPKLADSWKSAVWLGKSHLTDEHLFRTDDVYARSARRLAEYSWSEENHSSSSRNTTAELDDSGHSSCSRTSRSSSCSTRSTWKMRRREPTAKPEDDEEMQGAVGHKNDTTSFKIKQR